MNRGPLIHRLTIACLLWGASFLVQGTVLVADELSPIQFESDWNDEVVEEVAALEAVDQRRFELRTTFDYAVYGERAERGIARLHRVLREELATAQKSYEFDASQQKQLTLAGRGDIKHFVDKSEAFFELCLEQRVAFNNNRELEIALNALRRDRVRHHLFGPSSLFGKTLRKVTKTAKKKVDEVRDQYEQEVMFLLITTNLGDHPLRDEQKNPLNVLLQRTIQASLPIADDERKELVKRLIAIPSSEYEKILSKDQLATLRPNLVKIQNE